MVYKRIFLSVLTVLLAGNLVAFTQPRSSEPYQTKIVTEQVETMELPRIRMEGKHNIQMDYSDFFELSKPSRGESLLLTNHYVPSERMSLSVYPNSDISGGINQQTVTRYLSTLSDDAARKQLYFEIITPPTTEDAKAKIRFLGAKPITVEYAVQRIIDGEPKRVIVQDSWAQLEGETYLLRIEAPENRFDQFFAQSKGIATTMFFPE